ncbi:MAG: methyl-accepting chemotaxis protein [Lachnospiraceae bacterium]|nr:methyl-accepting chemotaxis protein [Ruminococcus sp.]MCM1275223.1 methyl-accepting chemotaxis protein [Lachnospiraceae bacterium]
MNKAKSIRNSIRRGNLMILAGGLFLTIFFTAALIFINVCQQASVHYSELLAKGSDVIIEANKFYRRVEDSVYGINPGSVDLSTPEFDMLYKEAYNDTGKVKTLSQNSKVLYDEYKTIASAILETASTDNEAALAMIEGEFRDKLNVLMDSLHDLASGYTSMSEQASTIVADAILFSTIGGGVFLVLMLVYSLKISSVMGNTIAKPVIAVAEWAEALSRGASNLDNTSMNEGKVHLTEIERMIKAFTVMADSVKENVDVVRKVADGDMTAYVKIRSSEDSLGKSLYKMVQSNDIMFAQISQIADSVTMGTDSIASAAKLLAESCTEQATAILDLQEDIKETNALTKENADNAAQASELSDSIHNEVVISQEKMQELVVAMKAIYDASQKVSGVIANIESLANQTNLLAINATIEAKRAGEAGKSFAVVASSVKDLADKSAISATQTKALIDDTIAKAKRGSQLSDETYTTFETIMESLQQIIEVSGKIAKSGATQHENMENIANDIDEISRIVSSNAASSEETAAMTLEISKNADVLKASMGQFNLRNREPGKPYIPPEKQNDKEFIRVATENYKKFINSAAGKKMMQEMNTDEL